MSCAENISSIIDEYIDSCKKILAEASPADGLLGIWNAPGKNPCHEAFLRSLEEETARMISEQNIPAEAYEATCVLLKAVVERECPEMSRWGLLSAHKAALPLIPFLNKEQRADLFSWYDCHISRRDRFPVQKAVYKLLKQ